MNSNQFHLQSSLEANYLNIRLDEQDHMDEVAIKVIGRDCPPFLIPFRVITLNDTVTLKYKLINTIALEYANMTLPKDLFVQMYLNLLTPFVKGGDWFLDYHNLCIDGKYVFIDKHTSEVSFIYVPVDSYRNTDRDILDFFNKVFMNVTITDDKDFQVQMFRFFGSGQVTLAGLYQLLSEAKGKGGASGGGAFYAQTKGERTPAPNIVPQNPSQAEPVEIQQAKAEPKLVSKPAENKFKLFGADKKEAKEAESKILQSEPVSYPMNENPEDEVIQALFGSKKPKTSKQAKAEKEKPVKAAPSPKEASKGFGGLFGGKKKEQEVSQSDQSDKGTSAVPSAFQETETLASTFKMNNAQSDETEIFLDVPANDPNPWLELLDFSQVGAMQRIELKFTKPYLVIGRISSDEVKPDIAFPGEFKRIGRQHARIEKKGNDFYIIDLGSVNHTMLNGQVLVPNQPYQLQNGMELAFTVSQPLRYRVHV